MTRDATSLEIQRATLAFNETEDRISLTCALSNAEIVTLWLTARLAQQLVPHLLQLVGQIPEHFSAGEDHLASRETAGNAASECLPGRVRAERNELIESTAADGPVVANADSLGWVISAVDVTSGPMLVQLTFRSEHVCAPALLSLEHMQLAQWLDGLKECFVQGNWSTDCWKDSVDAQQGRLKARQIAVH